MRKITVWGLDLILAPHLENTVFYEHFYSRLNFTTDDDNNILDNVMDNIKTMLKVAIRMTMEKDNPIAGKLKRALWELMDFGTEESSANIETFLASEESHYPEILLVVPGQSARETAEGVSRLFAHVNQVKSIRSSGLNESDLNYLINSAEQEFEPEDKVTVH